MNENAADWFVERHLKEGRGTKTVFRESGGDKRSISYAELSQRSAQFAGALQRADIRREERVACLVLDQIEYPEIFWGALKAGVIPVAINTLLSGDVYDTILRDSRAVCLIVSAELWTVCESAARSNPHLRKIVVVGGDTPADTVSYD